MADPTFVELLRQRAQERPDELSMGYLVDGDQDLRSLTYAELETEARRIAARLAARIAPGGRAVLVYEPGIEFMTAFFGCLFAGIVAVPVYPPAPPRVEAGQQILEHILRDCQAEAILTSTAFEVRAERMPGLRERTKDVPWIATDTDAGPGADAWRDRGVRASSVAFLQYTSGSTADPKGVILRHEHVVANARAIDAFGGARRDIVLLSWLPTYHDMGLVGAVMWPIHRGMPVYFLSPLHFLQQPMRWLRAVTRFRATATGGPNFGYDLCVRRASPETLAELDLSSWDFGFNGAEPIRSESVRRFEETFAPCGLRPGVIVGCYGMAEASLLITGEPPADHFRSAWVDAGALAEGRVEPGTPGAPGSMELASSGGPPAGHDVRIVDPETCAEVGPGRVGEIWYRGPNVAAGYWNRPELTAEVFGGVLADETDPSRTYLRTGDLGFLLDGRLYVTGRIKDLLIVRGRNVHPQDVEAAAQRVDRRLREGRGVAYAVALGDGEGIGLVQETAESRPEELRRLAALARQSVIDSVQAPVVALHLVKPRSILRTSSGKLRRAATRQALDEGRLAVLHRELEAVVVEGGER